LTEKQWGQGQAPAWQWPDNILPPPYHVITWRCARIWHNGAGIAFPAGAATEVAESAQGVLQRMKMAIPDSRIMRSNKNRMFIHDGSVFPPAPDDIVLAPGP